MSRPGRFTLARLLTLGAVAGLLIDAVGTRGISQVPGLPVILVLVGLGLCVAATRNVGVVSSVLIVATLGLLFLRTGLSGLVSVIALVAMLAWIFGLLLSRT